jgi:release factor glutamine methyltransferase
VTGLRVDEALRDARLEGIDRLDACVLLGHAMSRTRAWLLAHGDAGLDPSEAEAWRRALARRASGEPVAYIVGEKEFYGLTFLVDRRVLVPRPETEVLVSWGLEMLETVSAGRRQPMLLDLGTGSGAIAVACKLARPGALVFASDIDSEALAVARGNASRLRAAVEFRQGAWWEPWSSERFDVVLANPPYIAAEDPHLRGLAAEPERALVGGVDGLEALEAIVGGARSHLSPGGWLAVEHGFDQAPAVQRLLTEAGFQDCLSRADLAGINRCTGGRLRSI